MNTSVKIRCLGTGERIFCVKACVVTGFCVKYLHINKGFSFFRMGFFQNLVAGSLFILMKCFFLLSSISAGITPLLHSIGKAWMGLWLTFLFFILALFFSKPRSLKRNREQNGL